MDGPIIFWIETPNWFQLTKEIKKLLTNLKYNLEKNVNKGLFLTKQEDKVVIKNCGYRIGLLGVEDLHQFTPAPASVQILIVDPFHGPTNGSQSL